MKVGDKIICYAPFGFFPSFQIIEDAEITQIKDDSLNLAKIEYGMKWFFACKKKNVFSTAEEAKIAMKNDLEAQEFERKNNEVLRDVIAKSVDRYGKKHGVFVGQEKTEEV